MPVRFRCSSCSRTLSTASRKTGSFVSCPACRNAVLVEPVEKVTQPRRSTHDLDLMDAASLDFSMFELDPLPELELKSVKRTASPGPRVFLGDRLHAEPRPAAGGVGVRLFAWLAAVLVLIAIGAFLYFGFGPKI